MTASPSITTRVPAGLIGVVDQDEASVRRITDLLAPLGAEVRSYPTAGAFLSQAAQDLDCVICEMTLPDMSGIDLIRALRARGLFTPVILLATSDDVSVAVDGMRSGALDFLEKSGADRLLSRHVGRLIRRNEPPAPRSGT
ncbi:MAG TPA: response regulator [Gammaproteobacteria bacterium]